MGVRKCILYEGRLYNVIKRLLTSICYKSVIAFGIKFRIIKELVHEIYVDTRPYLAYYYKEGGV